MNIKLAYPCSFRIQFYVLLLTFQRTQIILKQYFNFTDRLVGWFIRNDNQE